MNEPMLLDRLSRFIGVVMRSQLRVVAHDAAAHNG
jgi:hypothetical protein